MRKLTNISDLEKCIIKRGNDHFIPVYDGNGNLVINDEILDNEVWLPFKEQILAVTEPYQYQESRTYYFADEQEKETFKQSHPIEMVEIEIMQDDIEEAELLEIKLLDEADLTQYREGTTESSDIELLMEEGKIIIIEPRTEDSI
jgi:hypothetical protein